MLPMLSVTVTVVVTALFTTIILPIKQLFPPPPSRRRCTHYSAGHVAVITKFSGSSMDVLEQNSSPTGKNTYSTGSVACYLHADKNSGGGSCNAAGWYCGDDNLQKDANTNYFCDGPGGSVTEHEDCGFTCVTNLSGYNDYCTSGGSCSGLYGYYCGNDKVSRRGRGRG